MFDLAINDSIARLTISRPERRNAIAVDGWSRLASTLDAVPAGKVLIVSSDGEGAFCAGADISDFAGFKDDPRAVAHFRTEMRRALKALQQLGNPSVALVDGACYGAGVALAMACDLRIAGPGARFAITPAKLGISYPQEDVYRLVSLVGAGQASRLLLSAQPIDGREAARIGLADIYVQDGAAAAAEQLAGSIASNDAGSLASLKHAVRLAEAGVSKDDEQDRTFDAMFQSQGFLDRLQSHRSSRK